MAVAGEGDVPADRVGERTEITGGPVGGGAGMHPHIGEVAPEARLEIVPRHRVERPTRSAEHVMQAARPRQAAEPSRARLDRPDRRGAGEHTVGSAVGHALERAVHLANRERAGGRG